MLLLATALAVVRPVLVTDAACHRDFVDGGSNGWLVPGCDAVALTAGMTAVLKRPDLLAGMARASRMKAERRLDRRAAWPALFGAIGLADLRVQAA